MTPAMVSGKASAAHIPAVLKALRFHGGSTDDLARIPENGWPELLNLLDRAQLTLALGVRCRDALPGFVRARVDRNLAGNAARHERLVAAHGAISGALVAHGISFVVMKGLSQWPYYTDDPGQRPQYDIDIYVPVE